MLVVCARRRTSGQCWRRSSRCCCRTWTNVSGVCCWLLKPDPWGTVESEPSLAPRVSARPPCRWASPNSTPDSLHWGGSAAPAEAANAWSIPIPDYAQHCWHWSNQTRGARSEEHTSELQSRRDLVCRLL